MPNYDVDKFADKLPSDIPLGSAESRRILRDIAIRIIALAELEGVPRPGKPKPKETNLAKVAPAAKVATLAKPLLSTDEKEKQAGNPTQFETITATTVRLPPQSKKPWVPKQVSKRPLKGRLVQHKFEV